MASCHPKRCLFILVTSLYEQIPIQLPFGDLHSIHQLLRKGANVRLLGLVIQRAAGAVPDKAHANAVEAWAYHKGISRHLKRFQMASLIALHYAKTAFSRACDSIPLQDSFNDKESMARMSYPFQLN